MASYHDGDLKKLLERHGFHFSKALGQNFLTDATIPERIADGAGVDASFGVLEVGPGVGALTNALCRRAARVVAVELDKRLLPVLNETLAPCPNVTVVSGDIMKLDIKTTVLNNMPNLRYAVCANLPYNITTPALTALFEAGIFETITVMVQKEVAQRLCAKPATPEYGAFTVFTQFHAEPKILFDVPPGAFMPQPKVTSAVVRLQMRPSPPDGIEDEGLFFRVVRASFAQRRKMLVNSLGSAFGSTLSKEILTRAVTDCGFDEKIRGETLDIAGFHAVSRAVGALLFASRTGEAR
ncbi:16S rRNA (adenine(1518)-N(6)/adenine(1519)-N(6))-dimethyltransferase RsmA [Oscillospiraceae bacterium WX1]